MNESNIPDPTQRIHELEAELARVRTERDLYKSGLYGVMRDVTPAQPMTPEELDEMMNSPRSEPLDVLIAQYKQQLGTM